MQRRMRGIRPLALVLALAALLCAFPAGAAMAAAQNEQSDTASAALESANYGVMTGSTAEVYISKTYPEAKISTFTAIADAFLALQGQKIDYVLTAYTTALNFCKNNDDLTVYKKDIIKETSSIAVAKDNTALLDKLNGLLESYKADGKLEKIASNWTTEGKDYVVTDVPKAQGANGTLRVAIAADREPMCFVDGGTYRGLDCELIESLAYDLDMKVEYSNMPFSSLVAALSGGKADVIISNMTATDERRKAVDFTSSYFDNPQVLVAKKQEQGAAYTNLAQLSGKVFSCLTGSVFDQRVSDAVENPSFLYFNTIIDQLTALRSGKVEAIPLDEPTAIAAVAKNPDMTIMTQRVKDDSFGVSLQKGSALTPQLTEVIARFKADGTLDALAAKWFGSDDSVKVLPELDFSGAQGTLRFAHDNVTEPMSYVGGNGQSLGYDVELVMRLAQAIGRKVELVPVNFSAMIPMLQSGKADIAAGCMSITEARLESVDMVPYYSGGTVLVIMKSSAAVQPKAEGFWASLSDSFVKTFITDARWKLVLDGLGVTLLISVLSAIFGSALGFLFCMLRRMKNRIASGLTAAFIRLIQGTPIVVLLMILYYVVFGRTDISAILVAVLGFSVNFGVYVSEMIRTGIEAVDKGQIEAALAIGYTKVQTFMKITLPQAARHFLPVYKGEFISMVKMTSVVGYIAIQDLTKVSDIIRSRTFEAFFPLIATALIYFVLAYLLTLLLGIIECKIDPKRRHRRVKGVQAR